MTHLRVVKTEQKPVTVKFRTKDGKVVAFKALETVVQKVRNNSSRRKK